MKLNKVDDKTAYENLLVKYAELENKIADIKANCDYFLEGKEIEYKEERNKLCADFENMKATLESKIAELKAENELIKNSDSLCKLIGEQKLQIERMKCCQNCKHCAKIPDYDLDNEEDNNIEFCEVRCHEKSGWELKEIKENDR